MDDAQRELRKALSPHWRGGTFAEVIAGRVIRVGMAWVEAVNLTLF